MTAELEQMVDQFMGADFSGQASSSASLAASAAQAAYAYPGDTSGTSSQIDGANIVA